MSDSVFQGDGDARMCTSSGVGTLGSDGEINEASSMLRFQPSKRNSIKHYRKAIRREIKSLKKPPRRHNRQQKPYPIQIMFADSKTSSNIKLA